MRLSKEISNYDSDCKSDVVVKKNGKLSWIINDGEELLSKSPKTLPASDTLQDCYKIIKTINSQVFPRVPKLDYYKEHDNHFYNLAVNQLDFNSKLAINHDITIGTAVLLEDIQYPDNIGKEVKFCQIVIRRNLLQYNFSPSLNAQESQSMEQLLRKAVEEIMEKEKLQNTVPPQYWINNLKEEFQSYKNAFPSYNSNKLLYTFKFSNDIDDCNIGIAINYGGDHLQILGCANKGDLGQLYIDVTYIYKLLADRFKFTQHILYGYLTSPMEFLGSGISIEVWLELPLVSKLPDLNPYLKEYNVQCVSSNNEKELIKIITEFALNGSAASGYVNIALASKFLSQDLEVELVKTLPLALRKEIMPTESLVRLLNMISKQCRGNSYSKKFLTTYLIDQYSNMKTRYYGTLGHCIRVNAICKDTLYPRASDPQAYTTFGKFLNLILQDHNKVSIIDHPNHVDYGAVIDTPIDNADSYILSHMIRFVRNIKYFPFSPVIFNREREEVENILIKAIKGLNVVDYSFEQLEKGDKNLDDEFIIETFERIKNDPVRKNIGAHRNWPKNRRIFKHECANKNIVIYIFINDVDHLKLKCIDRTGDNIDEMYEEATNIMKQLDEDKNIKFSKKLFYGFLTSSLKDTGTGMTLSSWIHLPCLDIEREKFTEICRENRLSYQSIAGKGMPVINSMFQINSNMALGHTETRQYNQYKLKIEKLLLEEMKATSRQKI